jgi:hypothetical protein
VSELDWIGCELYNLGSYWIFLLWIMDVDPFPRIVPSSLGLNLDLESIKPRMAKFYTAIVISSHPEQPTLGMMYLSFQEIPGKMPCAFS